MEKSTQNSFVPDNKIAPNALEIIIWFDFAITQNLPDPEGEVSLLETCKRLHKDTK